MTIVQLFPYPVQKANGLMSSFATYYFNFYSYGAIIISFSIGCEFQLVSQLAVGITNKDFQRKESTFELAKTTRVNL